jgi:hypothetical protein
MAISEICKDGIRVRLLTEDEQLFLQVLSMDEPEGSREGMTPCDPDVLCSVLRGLTYQLASPAGYCAIRREGATVTIELQSATVRHRCSMTPEQFSHLIWPVMPVRLRAMLL